MKPENINEEDWKAALEIAAQCWCDKETSHITMNTALAEAFARRYYELNEEYLIDYSQKDEHINQASVQIHRLEKELAELKAKPDPLEWAQENFSTMDDYYLRGTFRALWREHSCIDSKGDLRKEILGSSIAELIEKGQKELEENP